INGTALDQNPKHDAPIPLYKEVSKWDHEAEAKIKQKIRRNPQSATPTYEKEFTPWDGDTVEDYCQFRFTWNELEVGQALNAPGKHHTILSILSGQAKENWQTAISQLPADQQTTQQGFDTAMESFALCYCPSDARQKQRRFINKSLRLPKNMSIRVFWNRLLFMFRCYPHLPGTGTTPTPEHRRELLIQCLPTSVENDMTRGDYRWDDPNKTDIDLINYLTRLQTIGFSETRSIPTKTTVTKKKTEHRNFKKDRKNGPNKKKICDYCTKKKGFTFYGHTEDQCNNKKKDLANNKEEKHNIEPMDVENENDVTTRFGLSMSKKEISKRMFNEGDSNAKEMASLCDEELTEFLNIDDNDDDDVKLVMEKPIPKKKRN
ncbi:unnamed protein product, partial [Cylindrotheca closterium]